MYKFLSRGSQPPRVRELQPALAEALHPQVLRSGDDDDNDDDDDDDDDNDRGADGLRDRAGGGALQEPGHPSSSSQVRQVTFSF